MTSARPAGRRRNPNNAEPSGLDARRLAVFVVDAVTVRRRALDEAFNEGTQRLYLDGLPPRDRAFARAIATVSLRHCGRLQTLVDGYLEKPLPEDAGRTMAILVTSAAQIVLLASPAHAVVSTAVELARRDHTARRFERLVNAVLRRIAADGKTNYASLEPSLDCPAWLLERWVRAYGAAEARAILQSSLVEPPLDLTVKADPAAWAAALSGVALATGSVRVREAGRIDELPGFDDGAWWVQDAAAALPARLLDITPGCRIADLCAAPGGKSAQLSAAGADVVAVDASSKRMARLETNMKRLGLAVEAVVMDVDAFAVGREGTFDAVLVDAPCSATGTIRRHPDLLHLKDQRDIESLPPRQIELLCRAMSLVKPGGQLVYTTCSLEREEGEEVVEQALARVPGWQAVRIAPDRLSLPDAMVTSAGYLRTLPHQSLGPEPVAQGLDGFFAALLRRSAT